MKKVLFLLLTIIYYAVLSQSNTVGLITNSPEAYNGYTLFSPMGTGNTSTYLIDNCGYKVHEWNSSFQPALLAYLSDSGMLVRTKKISNSFASPSGGGGVEMLDYNSNVVWSYDYSTDIALQHHDIEIMPNGNILILAWEKKTGQEAIIQGRNPDLITNDEIWPEYIIEIEPIGNNEANIVWEWHVWDHLVQDFNPELPNYDVISEHPGLFNINYIGPASDNNNYSDWQHANSIDYNKTLDQIMITSRRWSEIWIIDHSTTIEEAATSEGGNSGMGGDVLYRWGNPLAYNRGEENNRTLFGPHDAHWIQPGLPNENKIMIFNNGTPEMGFSSVDIIDPPLEFESSNYLLNNNIYGPENLHWSYSEPDFFSRQISGSEQLPNGNILICSGNQGRIFEVDYYNNNILWEYISPFTNNTGPVQQGSSPENIQNNVFRAYKFSPFSEALSNFLLEPTSVIELNSYSYNCQIYGCLNVTACNYNPNVTDNNNTCIYPGDICELENGETGVYNDKCECIQNTFSVNEMSNPKNIIKTIDFLGRETTNTGFQLLIYDDGYVERNYLLK